jgi:hypothetical protein
MKAMLKLAKASSSIHSRCISAVFGFACGLGPNSV